MDTTTNTGITLALLAPFLPYGIRVASQWTDGSDNTTGVLLGIDMSVNSPVIWSDGKDAYKSSCANVLPVLRSFADLCTPLADGRVPAMEVAKLLTNDWLTCCYYKVTTKGTGQIDIHALTFDLEVGEVLVCRISILKDWNFLRHDKNMALEHLENIIEAIDYLRSKHFAVGLEPNQFIRKTE